MKIGVVPYINALPLCRYLDAPLEYAPPAELSRLLLAGDLDVALVPIVTTFAHPELSAYPDTGVIQSDGAVASVLLFCPPAVTSVRTIDEIVLSEESITSNILLKVLTQFKWGCAARLVTRAQGGRAATLRIGDDALFNKPAGYQTIDLGEEWTEWTGLPFVYATWVARRPLTAAQQDLLRQARDTGLARIESIINEQHDLPADFLRTYLTENIH